MKGGGVASCFAPWHVYIPQFTKHAPGDLVLYTFIQNTVGDQNVSDCVSEITFYEIPKSSEK